jgi:uncharacterized protein
MFTWNCSRYTEYFKDCREAVDNGYALKYENLAQAVLPEEHCLSTDQCRELLDILVMFGELKGGYEALENETDIEKWSVEFSGFDGNNESTRLGYCRFLCDRRHRRFENLNRGDDFNSHMPTMDGYRRMLEVWK